MRRAIRFIFPLLLLLAAHPTIAQRIPADTTHRPAKKSEIVYITRKGNKYHREDCIYLRKSKIALPLLEAKKYYTPCKKCKPPE